MNLSHHLDLTLQQTLPPLSHFNELIDLNWIEACLKETGKASIRKRKLPAEHVVWLVIGLALFRDQPIWYVVQQLQLVFGTTQYCVPSASVQARQRLGLEPLQALFSTLIHRKIYEMRYFDPLKIKRMTKYSSDEEREIAQQFSELKAKLIIALIESYKKENNFDQNQIEENLLINLGFHKCSACR